ncbi:MAG: nucleotide-binding protein [Candidatus Hodgkinia cicadicola]
MVTKFLTIAGTASNVGKTLLSASLCEIGRRMGLNIVPFKAQNMCSETVTHANGSEVSSAQWHQLGHQPPNAHVNPILIKPSEQSCALYLRGALTCEDFVYPGPPRHRSRVKALILESALELSRRSDVVLIEGAGALSEVNLLPFDLTNFWLARALSSKIVLLSDLERGGALSSIAGTRSLMSAEDAPLVIGFVLNRFIGRANLLKAAVTSLERATSWPCFGILPKLSDSFHLPWEDALSKPTTSANTAAVIVIDLPLEDSGGELATLALEAKWALTYAKVPPLSVPPNLKLVIIPNCPPTSSAFGIIEMWFQFLTSVKCLGLPIMALGFGFHALSSASEVGSFGRGLKLFPAETLMSRRQTSPVNCKCPLTRRDMTICGQAITVCQKINYPTIVLLHSADKVWGISTENSLGIGLTGSLLNDEFRRLLLTRIKLPTSAVRHQSALRTSLERAAAEVAPYLDAKLLSHLSGRTASHSPKWPNENSFYLRSSSNSAAK